MIKAVIFDLWGTLAHNIGVHPTRKALESLGLPYEEPYTRMLEEAIMTKRFDDKHTAFTEFCRFFDMEPTKELVKLIADHWKDIRVETQLYPEAQDVINDLKKMNIHLGLLSNTVCFSSHHLEDDLQKMFDTVVLSCDIGMLKPDLGIFKYIMKQMGVEPEETLMIGDYPKSDMACEQLGIKGVLIDRRKKYVEKKADCSYRIDDLTEVLRIIKEINEKNQE